MQSRDLMLGHYRVLDLTDEKGWLCGKILGDLGADVIKIEKSGGDPGRNNGPFYHDIPDPEKSLYWFAYNTSKRGITLNIETADGKEVFKRLTKTADFVIESFPPGYLADLGLDYSTLSKINPRIIVTSITPFGQEGPYKDYQAPDLVAEAMSGMLYVMGDTDRPPVRFSVEQAYCMAGAHGAAGSLIAHHYRELTGGGQHVDVSIQEALMAALTAINSLWWGAKTVLKRQGIMETRVHLRRPVLFQCRDGQVSFVLVTAFMADKQAALVDWMDSEGMAGDLKDVDWRSYDLATITQEQLDAWLEPIKKFFMTHTKSEISEEAAKRNMFIYPVSNTKDIMENKQLEARDFWQPVQHPELLTSIVYPGAIFKATETDWRISSRAPLIGEHNTDIYENELSFSRDELILLKQHNTI